MLDLHGKHCLIVGFGKVGQRKLATLLKASPATVTVLDMVAKEDFSDSEISSMLNHSSVVYEQRSFQHADIKNKILVFASTGDKSINKAVADVCSHANILCNSIDDPSTGTFTVPAHIERGDLLITLSTGGASPALSRVIKKELQEVVGDKYAPVVELMKRIRPLILEQSNDTALNTAVFRALVHSEIADVLHQKDRNHAKLLLQSILPETLHSNIGALLHELI